METLKRFWWLFLVVPIVGYFLWVYYQEKNKASATLAKAREAKEQKKIIQELEQTENENVRES
jgi:hypothetical protein